MIDGYKLGKKIQELRTEQQLTCRQLGAKLDVGESIVAKWCKGKRVPSRKNLRKLANFFKFNPLEYSQTDFVESRIEEVAFTNDDLNKMVNRFNAFLRLQDQFQFTTARKNHIDYFDDKIFKGDVYLTGTEYGNYYPVKLSRKSMFKFVDLIFTNIPEMKQIADKKIEEDKEENRKVMNKLHSTVFPNEKKNG
tara:strand:+ start:1447 stop:2025 length:579 start_codon:yes stop_codon:yes gene_type:complete